MSEFTDNPRKKERHRRRRGGGNGANANQGGRSGDQARTRDQRQTSGPARDASGGRRDQQKENRRERREEQIPLPKLPTPTCPRCGQPIQDITSALADREGGAPVHFDCVLSFLQGAENLAASEKLAYIGHGRFAVVVFENPSDTRKFRIVRTIEWENRETAASWRADIAGLFSQVK